MNSHIDQKQLDCWHNYKNFPLFFFKHLTVLGLTKPLSDTLQSQKLNLATAIDLVGSICMTLNDRCLRENLWRERLTLEH